MTGGINMYPYYGYRPYENGGGYSQYPLTPYTDHSYFRQYESFFERQQTIRGQASWTEGGSITQCGIPWSQNQYMTVAVGTNSPYKCGQSLKVRNLSTPGSREIIVTVVDQVVNYPANKLNLHRRAFEALGAHPSLGVINVEIIPSPELEQERWGKYLLEVALTAYPGYNVTEYQLVGKTQVSPQQTKETYDFILQSPRDRMRVRGNVDYNPVTNRVISFNLVEV